jgi:hypothetical protein
LHITEKILLLPRFCHENTKLTDRSTHATGDERRHDENRRSVTFEKELTVAE